MIGGFYLRKIILLDALIGSLCIVAINKLPGFTDNKGLQVLGLILLVGILIGVTLDLLMCIMRKSTTPYSLANGMQATSQSNDEPSEIALLNEEDEIIKTWELKGHTALIIGRQEKSEQEVHINLDESIYSALIDPEHAVLNYAAESWFIEDLHSSNGVRIQKTQDGQCYKLATDKPCKLLRGDIILIANTRLLVR